MFHFRDLVPFYGFGSQVETIWAMFLEDTRTLWKCKNVLICFCCILNPTCKCSFHRHIPCMSSDSVGQVDVCLSTVIITHLILRSGWLFLREHTDPVVSPNKKWRDKPLSVLGTPQVDCGYIWVCDVTVVFQRCSIFSHVSLTKGTAKIYLWTQF